MDRDNQSVTPTDVQAILRDVTQNLAGLQSQLTGQLGQDIKRLQAKKQQLLDDLDILEEEYQDLQQRYDTLQNNHDVALSQQQLAQQQLWAKRLAQALASHFKTRLTESVQAAMPTYSGGQPPSLDNAYQLLASLDSSLSDTLRSLQQDLNSYRSTLSQQIGRMQSMEQQGEVILEALINRLSQQLQTQMMRPPGVMPLPGGEQPRLGQNTGQYANIPPSGHTGPSGPAPFPSNHWQNISTPLPTSTPQPLSSRRSPDEPRPRRPRSAEGWQRGVVCMVLATVAIALHNVWVGSIGSGQAWGAGVGQFTLALPQVLMLLWLRMLVVLPVIALVAVRLYPEVWRDLKQLFTAADRRPLFQVIISGVFLFISQVLIYKAITAVGAGVAIALLFTYPLLTVPLAWFLFGDRPTPLKAVVMAAVAMGVVFTVLPRLGTDGTFLWSVAMALLASGAFALYMIAMQLSSRRLHPVPVNMVQFATLFVLSGLIFLATRLQALFQPVEAVPETGGLVMGGIVLGVLTVLWYLFNTYGVRFMGATQAALVAAAVPILTAIIAVSLTPALAGMHFLQWIGVAMITLGTFALSAERLSPGTGAKPKRVRA